jgi:hypothetical protein
VGTIVYSQTPNTGVAVDHGAELVRIAVALEQLSSTMTTISNKMTTISNAITNVSNAITNVSDELNNSTLVSEIVVNINQNIIELPSSLSFDPSGFFIQGSDILSNSYVISYYSASEKFYLKTNQVAYPNNRVQTNEIENKNPLTYKFQEVSLTAKTIFLVSPAVMASINTSLLSDQAINKDGLHVISPWEWLNVSSIVRFYQENNVNLTELKNIVDNLPKSINTGNN